MSDKANIKESNIHIDHTDWLEELITNEYLNYYEYSDFKNMEPIGKGTFGKVSRANWRNTHTIFILKSFDDYKSTLKQVVNEVLKIQDIK